MMNLLEIGLEKGIKKIFDYRFRGIFILRIKLQYILSMLHDVNHQLGENYYTYQLYLETYVFIRTNKLIISYL